MSERSRASERAGDPRRGRPAEGLVEPPLPARAAGYGGVAAVHARLRACGARVEVIGRGADGGEVVAVAIGEAGPATVILGGLHPIEWIGVEVAVRLVERLAAAPPAGRRVVAVPLVNVDGYARVEGDLRAGRRRWRRANPGGVDLNRNFPVHFAARRRLPTGWNWGGRAPASEPEVAAVVATVRAAAARGQVDRAVSLHSIGNKVLVPWGGRWARPARWAELEAAARAVAARLPGYSVVQCARWVPGAFARGMELDWLHAELGALALLVECTAGGLSLRDRRTWGDPFRWFNPADPAAHARAVADAVEPFARGDVW